MITMKKLKSILLLFLSVLALSLMGLIIVNLMDIIIHFTDAGIFYISNLIEKYVVYAITYLSAVIIISTYFILSAIKKLK